MDNGVVPGPWRGTAASQNPPMWPSGPRIGKLNTDYARTKSTEDTSPTSIFFPRSTDSPGGLLNDERRPSIASIGSISGGAPRTQKKLHAFFGEDVVPFGEDAQQNLSTPNEEQDENGRPPYNRNVSYGNHLGNDSISSRAVSPSRMVPKAPDAVSSEVTPWMFQDAEVSESCLCF